MIARTLNVKVNDQDVLRELTDKEKQRQASTAPVRKMLERNQLWLQPELSEADSLSYTFHALREDIKEACCLNKDGVAVFEITHDGEIKPSGRELENNTGRRSLALPNGQWASGDRSQEYFYIHEPNRERSEPYSLRLRRYGLIGCQFDLPLFRINEVLDNLRTTTTTGEWNGIECDVVSMSGTGRHAWLGTGTMLAFSSWSYVHHIYPASTTLYLDKVRHVPLHESILGSRDKDFEIDYSDWKEVEPGQWVPLSIKVESKDYFICEYQFQLVAGKHWMLKELTSWFDAANKSRAVVSDVEINKPSDLWNQAKTQLDKTERLFSRPTEVADRSNASSVTLQTTPIEFGHWTAIDDVQVMLTVASIKSLILKVETKQEPAIARLTIVLFDSQGRPFECGSVALQQIDDKWAGELLLSNIDASNLTEIAVAGRGGDNARTISVEPIQIGISQPVNFPDNQQGKTRAAELEVTQPENSDLMARVKVVSVNGPKGFPVVVDVILFDGQDQPIRCAQHRESFRVDGKPDIHDVVVNLGAIPLTVPTARAAVIVRNEQATTFPIGSGWGKRMGFPEVQVPVEKLFAAEDPACRAIAVQKIISQLSDRNIEKEFFEEPRDRARLAERKQLASDIVGPFVMQLESILQIQTDESLQRDAARLLGFSGNISRVDRLLTLLDAKDEATCDVAAIALAMLKSDAGIGRFAPILERPVPDIETERDAWRQFSRTQQDALIALATLNSDAAVDLLGETMIRDLQTLTLNQSDNGRTHLTGRADRAGRILSLSQRLNDRIVPWLGKAVEYFENNPTIGKEFSQSALAMALLKHQGKSKTTIESQIRKLNNSYVDAIRESRNPYYRSAIQEMLLNENSGPWMFQKGVDYLSGINTPESIAFLKELYDRRLPEDISARMRLCESLVQFNDERGLVEALEVMSDSFADPTTGPDGVALKKDVKLQEEKRKRSEYVLRRASNDMILEVVAEQINADINNDSNIQTCRAILVFLRSTGTLPEEIEQSVRQWATHADPSLKSEASEFLETRGILPQK
ncbi:MAG: hypothetical protein KDB01_10215 [Planctomycetaceae bacterium]|nr:hypothetical protein [Planctomycetaceae bacterium]